MKALILLGGSGTRLWPLSRKKYPKQFLKIFQEKSFFQNTVQRLLQKFREEDLYFSVNEQYYLLARDQLRELGLEPEDFQFVIEPVSRNTAPALILALRYLEEMDVPSKEALLVAPSDHLLYPEEPFFEALKKAETLAQKGYLVTFGIKPSAPETGYGYIEKGETLFEGAFKAQRFVEKPDRTTAEAYFSSGNFFWNSGMFIFTPHTFWEELSCCAPELFERAEGRSYEELRANFSKFPDISIDYALMERSRRVAVIPLKCFWSDVGSWEAVYEVAPKDEKENYTSGRVLLLDTEKSLILGNTRLVATIGLSEAIVVETADAVLVTRRGHGQRVREVVKKLQQDKATEALTRGHLTEQRPWGSFTELERGHRYRIKRITVKPGEALSLQMHHHRSEHWVVVRGTARVTIGDKTQYVHENESVYVPKSTLHRLENPGKIPLEIIEVQVGEYLEEDDIIRFEDRYGRTKKK